WGAMSYNQPAGLLIVPLNQSCMDWYVRKTVGGGNGAVRRFLSTPGTNGNIDRYVRAFDVKTGKVLWQSRLGTSAQGFPITYSVDGKQYIAVMTGLGGG